MQKYSAESLASQMLNAYMAGWEDGRDLIPQPDPEQIYLEFLSAIEHDTENQVSAADMGVGQVRH